jgi:signal transduction histidine kinase
MPQAAVESGSAVFQTEGRLLQELGERLVASPEVALVELIKNAYDADAPSCIVCASKNDLQVVDDGTGMTLEQFLSRWMRIATSNKSEARVSEKYGRRLTGQKGIGRFAVRFLGDHLLLESVAFDEVRKFRTKLEASFDWTELDTASDISRIKIPYKLTRASASQPIGTSLTIKNLKVPTNFVQSSEFRTSVLKIVSPISGLQSGRFGRDATASNQDPGFSVTLPGEKQSDGHDLDLAGKTLSHAWAALTIDLKGSALKYSAVFHDGTKSPSLEIKFKTSISQGLFADIRFFPRRSGIFKAREVDGKAAWEWIRNNHGVAIVDHGFRIKPYGFQDDDWLNLDIDAAHNRRDWRTEIASENFPISKAAKDDPAINSALNLPTSYQVVGAVFVESIPSTLSKHESDLIPSMDREGFVNNRAFKELHEIVRGGLEYLANEDKKRMLDAKEQKAREAANRARSEFKDAIEYIKESATLTKADKLRLVEEYTGLAARLEEVEAYDREARRRIEVMSSLGVVAGFLTHESTRILAGLKEAIDELKKLVSNHPSLRSSTEVVESGFFAFKDHVEYTQTFIDSVQRGTQATFRAAPQIRRIISRFGHFANEREIVVQSEIPEAVESPSIPVAVYSGIFLNLYTNALKAIIASPSSQGAAKVVFRGWNDPNWHVIEVLDTGIGIPPNLRKRIWDPLFTTTSRLNNPLGSGMGLGLSLVKQLVSQLGGKIDLVDPPAGFNTCFKVQFPRKAK